MAAQTDVQKKGSTSFFRGVRLELKRVTWPNKDELLSYTTVVLVICGIMTAGLWVVDAVFNNLLKLVM
jgi:preprotein translocase subunit SecE